MIRLGVNIDHIATLRNARGENHPDILKSALHVIKKGADLITIHLREDRRHINDEDLKILSKRKSIPINLEMAANNKMLKIALKYKPKFVCIVPEKRQEITTEGGLNLKKNFKILKRIINQLNKKNIRTSLFINPNLNDVRLSSIIKTKCIELHTGNISRKIKAKKLYKKDLNKIIQCAKYASVNGIETHAGHGMDYKTAKVLSKVKQIKEFNIGHFIIGESIFSGIDKVIKKFKKFVNNMKIIGNGVDIIENLRIQRLLKNSKFINRIYSSDEIQASRKVKNKVNFFAKRFAAKEAFVKSLGTGFRNGLNFKDISVKNNRLGKPQIYLSKNIKSYLKKKFKFTKLDIFLSLSDEKKHSIAFVIINTI